MINEFSFKELYALQKGLDEDIAKRHDVTYENTFERRLLALFVELGEFANETRCFKFWSLKGPSGKERILDEYADALHFLLSLGLAIGIDDYNHRFQKSEMNLSKAILTVYEKVLSFDENRDQRHYEEAFASFLDLLPLMGYDFLDMEKAYKAKLAVNFLRQEQKY